MKLPLMLSNSFDMAMTTLLRLLYVCTVRMQSLDLWHTFGLIKDPTKTGIAYNCVTCKRH